MDEDLESIYNSPEYYVNRIFQDALLPRYNDIRRNNGITKIFYFIDLPNVFLGHFSQSRTKEKKDCYDLKIITANLNFEFLKFKEFFKPSNCIDTNNSHGYWPHQGAGGRIFLVDNNNILFTTGDFRNRPLAQNLESDY